MVEPVGQPGRRALADPDLVQKAESRRAVEVTDAVGEGHHHRPLAVGVAAERDQLPEPVLAVRHGEPRPRGVAPISISSDVKLAFGGGKVAPAAAGPRHIAESWATSAGDSASRLASTSRVTQRVASPDLKGEPPACARGAIVAGIRVRATGSGPKRPGRFGRLELASRRVAGVEPDDQLIPTQVIAVARHEISRSGVRASRRPTRCSRPPATPAATPLAPRVFPARASSSRAP